MKTPNKPWYCQERYQGSLVSWREGAAIFLGTEVVYRPGMPERTRETMLRVMGPGTEQVLLPPYAVQLIGPPDDK